MTPGAGPATPGRRQAAIFTALLSVASMVFLLIKGLLFAPLFLRTIGAAAYGNWLASGNVISMLGALEAGFAVVYMQRLATSHGEGDPEGFARETGSGALALAVASIVVAALALVLAPFVPGWTRALPEIHRELKWAFVLAGVGSGATIFQASVDVVFGAWQRPLVSGILRLGSRGLEVVILYVTLKLGCGLLSFGISAFGAAACGTAAGWLMVRRAWRARGLPQPRVAGSTLRVYLRQTPPSISGRAGATLLNNNEALIISNLASPEIATAYVLTDRVYKLGQMLVGFLGGAAFAGVAHLAAEDRDGARLRAVLVELLVISSLGAAFCCGGSAALNSAFVSTLLGPQYFGGHELNALLAVGSALIIRANLFGTLLQALGWPGLVGWSSIVELVLRLPLVFTFVRAFGIIGMPVAIITTTVVVNLGAGTYLLARRLHRGALEVARDMLVKGFLSTAAAIAIGIALARYVGAHRGWRLFILDSFWIVGVLAVVLLSTERRARELVPLVARKCLALVRGAS